MFGASRSSYIVQLVRDVNKTSTIEGNKSCTNISTVENETEKDHNDVNEPQCSFAPANVNEKKDVLISDGEESSPDEAFSSGSGELYEPSEGEKEISQEEEEPVYSSNAEETAGLKKRRKGQINRKEWKRQKNAELRLQGKDYVGFTKNEEGRYQQTKQKKERSILPRCNGHQTKRTLKGGPRQSFDCATITEAMRHLIFSSFWKLSSWEAKKVFVAGCVVQTHPKYRRSNVDADDSRKNVSFKYYLVINEGLNNKVKKCVCKKMFLNTLCIGEKAMRLWILDGDKGDKFPVEDTAGPVEIGLTSDKKSAALKNVEEFLNSLPKMESHYCRSSSNKLYLEATWYSFRDMHRYYSEKCRNENKPSISWKTFLKVIRNMNLDIYAPKKDQCNTCIMYKQGTIGDEVFQAHTKKKNDARSEKERDKISAINCPEIQSYTVDLQAVLLAPRLNATANYYKTKLKVHNLTYYNLSTKDVMCYVWHEANGGLESDVFASIATIFFLKEIENKKPQKIIIWSDGCGYQNRNVKLSNALVELSVKHNVIIEHKYLEVGHTQMEVDSIHSSIEKKLRKRREVYVPADYLNIIHSARQNPKPYGTVYLQYSDFLKFEPVFYGSIRPGNKVGDPCVNDVVAYQYTPEGVINYKTDFVNEWTLLPTRPKRVDNNLADHSNLYEEPCPIEETKFKHLQELAKLLPLDYRNFYNSLTYK